MPPIILNGADFGKKRKHTPKNALTYKKLVVLDLDNTCICAIEHENEKDDTPLTHPSSVHPEWHKGEYVDLDRLYRIYSRPNLQEFLDILFRDYDVAVWTAADLDYALFVIEHFITPKHKSGRTLQFIMWAEHCEHSENHTEDEQSKQLDLLSSLYDVDDMVLIDDNKDVLRQIKHTINSNYFDVTKSESVCDSFFPYECLDKITKHFNTCQRLNDYNSNKMRYYLLPVE